MCSQTHWWQKLLHLIWCPLPLTHLPKYSRTPAGNGLVINYIQHYNYARRGPSSVLSINSGGPSNVINPANLVSIVCPSHGHVQGRGLIHYCESGNCWTRRRVCARAGHHQTVGWIPYWWAQGGRFMKAVCVCVCLSVHSGPAKRLWGVLAPSRDETMPARGRTDWYLVHPLKVDTRRVWQHLWLVDGENQWTPGHYEWVRCCSILVKKYRIEINTFTIFELLSNKYDWKNYELLVRLTQIVIAICRI